MTKFKNLANVAAAFSKTDKKSPGKNIKNAAAQKWKKVKVPVKAMVLLKLSAQKKENSKSGISKRKTVKPNPAFKKEAWKKSPTGTSTKSAVSKSTASKSSSKSNLTDKKPLNIKAKSSLDASANRKNAPGKGILKTEPAVKSRKKSVTINPRERKSISGRSPRPKTKSVGNKAKKDDHLEQTPPDSSSQIEAELSEVGGEGECSESRKTALKHWRKIRLMLYYLKLPPPGIINLAKKNMKEEISFTANLKALQMGAKFKEICQKQKNSVPRCGGKREHRSFDYLGSL